MKKAIAVLVLCLLLVTPAFAGWNQTTLLDGVITTGASSALQEPNATFKTAYVIASGVTTGGTVLIQTSPDNTNWATIATVTVSASGASEVAIVGLLHRYIRANLSARTDGTYTVILGYGS